MYYKKMLLKCGADVPNAAARSSRSFRRLVLPCLFFCVLLLLCGCSSEGGSPADSSNSAGDKGPKRGSAVLSVSRVENETVSLAIKGGKGGFCLVVARDQEGNQAGLAVKDVAEGQKELAVEVPVAVTPAIYQLQAYLLDKDMQLVSSSQPQAVALRSDTVSTGRVSGVFAVPELSSEVTQEQWNDALRSMKEIGIDTVIVQYSLQQDRDRGLQAYFPYKEKDTVYDAAKYPLRRQQIEYILSAASSMDMKVFLGLQLAEEEWFHQNKFRDAKWLNSQYKLSVELADALWAAFGEKYANTIVGWYLPFEFESDDEYHGYYKQIAEKYYGPLTADLKSRSQYKNLSLMISPMMCRTDDIDVWQQMVSFILRNSQIDIIAPQDGIGYGTQTHDSLEEWFRATRAAVDTVCAETGKKIALWANCENYARLHNQKKPDPLELIMPMSIRKFIDSMDIAAPYVDKLITFSIHRWAVSLEAPKEPEVNKSYYEAYQRFYKSGNKPQGKAEGYYVNIYAEDGSEPLFNQYTRGGLTDGFAADPDNWKEYLGIKTSGKGPFVMEISFDDPVSVQSITSNYFADKAAGIGLPLRVNYEYFVRSNEKGSSFRYYPLYQEEFPNAKGITKSVAAAENPVVADGIRITVTPSAEWTFLDEIWVQ